LYFMRKDPRQMDKVYFDEHTKEID
jgi:hypothetical protein